MSRLDDAAVRLARQREQAAPAALRRAHGVVHTPAELARWALSRADTLLRRELALEHGLSDSRVQLLDPAVGTGVWLATALELTRGASRPRSVQGFDVDAAALEATRALLGAEAGAQGVELALHCRNTLELADPWPAQPNAVRVVIGNPPWAARSRSRGGALSDGWLEEFRRDGTGERLAERRTGVLSDDYVRFFRWALEQARTAPAGALVCLATNASFLDGPVHRGMRAALSAAFDHIQLLDLGGNSLLSRGSVRDENLFGVRVGAALTLALRLPGRHKREARLELGSLRGAREEKLAALAESRVALTSSVVPRAPWFRFGVQQSTKQAGFFSLADAFPFHREGVQTNRDALVIAADASALRARLERIARGAEPLPPSRHFDPARARATLARALADTPDERIVQLAYRPFDTRYACVVPPLCHRPRPELLAAVRHSELCLLSVRKDRGGAPFNLFAAAREPADACFLSTRSSCRTRVFPSHTPDGELNIAPALADAFARVCGAPAPSAVIHYVLGVLAAAGYRAAQGEALKLDYPRVPLPPSSACHAEFSAAGAALASALCAPIALLPGSELRLQVAPERSIDPAGLVFCTRSAALLQHDELLFSGVQRAAWDLSIGHQPWRAVLAARPDQRSAGALHTLLRRADAWIVGLSLAEAAFQRHFPALAAAARA